MTSYMYHLIMNSNNFSKSKLNLISKLMINIDQRGKALNLLSKNSKKRKRPKTKSRVLIHTGLD